MEWSRSVERLERVVRTCGPGPWTQAQLLAAGVTPAQMKRDVHAGRLTRLRRGVYAVPASRDIAAHRSDDRPALPTPGLLADFGPVAAFSHETASALNGTWLPKPADGLVHVSISGGVERSDRVFRVHGSRLAAADVAMLTGLRVTSVPRTALDLGRGLTFPEALVPMDSAYRQLVLGTDLTGRQLRRLPDDLPWLRARTDAARAQLEDAFTRVWSWPGTRVLRAALDNLECRSESPYESWCRGWVIEAGAPTPRVGMRLLGASGREYFGDLVWESHRLIGEADGVAKLGTDPRLVAERLEAERVRQRDLEDAGWRFVRWNSGERPQRFTARILSALA